MRKKTKKLGALLLSFAMVLTSVTLPQGKKASAAPNPNVEKYETDEEATLPEADWIDQLITGADMKEAGIDVAALQNKSVTITPIIKVTKAHDRSFIRFTGGSYKWEEIPKNTAAPGSTEEPSSTEEPKMKFTSYGSNKALIGIKHAGADGASSTKFIIHNGYGTGKEGTGVGAAGTGIYNKISNINTSRFAGGGSVSDPDSDHVFVRLQIRTKDTEARIIGIIFGDGQSFSVGEDGKCTAGFDESQYKYESDVPDATDVAPLTAKEKLEASLTTAKEITQSDCIDEASWQALQAAITDAESVLDTADDDTLSAKQTVLQQKIVAATSKNRMGLKSSIDYCSDLKADDYTSDTFSKLQPAIEAATTIFNDTTKTDLEYKDARDDLEIVRTKLAKIPSTDPGKPKTFRVLTKDEVVKEMGAGTNLGNTFDGGLNNATETNWQAFRTTKEYIKALHDAGYNTVRIPVTWNGYINDDYSIKEEWISRVQEVVDYCIDQDMYCILNIHHDGAKNHDNRGDNDICWLDTYAYDIETVYQKYEGVWKTIANRFKDYDEHLIFESMNEVTDAHGTAPNEDTKVLNCLNQLFVNTVRATGSNNAKRWLGITGRFATFSTGTTKPDDTLVADGIDTTRLMFAVHIYKDNTATRWSYDSLKTWESSLHSSVNNVAKLDPNMPLYVGEYGVRIQAQPGSETGYNNVERALNYEVCTAIAKYYNAVNVVWDQGAGDYNREEIETGLFTDWNRPALKPYFEDTVQGLIRGTYDSYTEENVLDIMAAIYKSYGHETVENNDISKNPEIAQATTLTLDKTSATLKAGQWEEIKATTDSAKDIVLWSTDDDSIATVSQGKIRAKKMGATTIHAYTQSGSVKEDVKVVVTSSGEETSTAIAVEKALFELKAKETAQIQAALTPADSQDEITYKSSNPEIASVSKTGKITALSAGNTYITVSSASGVATIVKVVVASDGSENQVDVTMNILYGSGHEEVSQPVTLTGDQQYTVSYDLATELSEEGQKAGITKIADVTAIYLKDPNSADRKVVAAKLRYDKLTVNDIDIPLDMQNEAKQEGIVVDEDGFKDFLKKGGELNSNTPVNAWDKCAAEAGLNINSSSHTASFKDIENPTRISLTFTVKDLEFVPGVAKENPATEIASVTEQKIVIPQVGESKEIEITLSPKGTDSEITFFSADSSIVDVNSNAVLADEDGKVSIKLIAMGAGTTTITGITENGLQVLYTVGVGDMQAASLPNPTNIIPDEIPTEPCNSYPPTPGENPGTSSSPAPSENPGTSSSPAPSENPGTSPSPAPSGNPGTSPSPAPTLPVKDTVVIAKKSIVVAAGKSAKVSLTTTGTAQLSVKTSNNKIKASISGNTLLISVDKKATKGASYNITVSRGSASAVIKLTVRNKAKAVKAAKTKAIIKKKGKTTTLTIKVTKAENKKKAVTDNISVKFSKKKIAKVASIKKAKGKITIKIKGLKKGSTNVKVKVGSKSAKAIKLTVK